MKMKTCSANLFARLRPPQSHSVDDNLSESNSATPAAFGLCQPCITRGWIEGRSLGDSVTNGRACVQAQVPFRVGATQHAPEVFLSGYDLHLGQS